MYVYGEASNDQGSEVFVGGLPGSTTENNIDFFGIQEDCSSADDKGPEWHLKVAGIDLSPLIISEGKICWDLYIDGLVVSADGNLLDTLAAAIKVALSNTGIPKITVDLGSDDQPEVDVSDKEFSQFDTSKVPVIVTLTKVGKHYIVNATSEEKSQMSSAVLVSVNRNGQICGMSKRGGAGLDPSIILDMVSVAKHVLGARALSSICSHDVWEDL